MYMKNKYKKAEMLFECFHNRGHPETYIPEKKPENHNALERVAVMSDEIADGVRDNCARWKEIPYIPGRSRFKLMYKGEEVVKPMRKTMKKLAQKLITRNTAKTLVEVNFQRRQRKRTGALLDNAMVEGR
jgi:hypothetical protein